MNDTYEQQLAAWKLKHGVKTPTGEDIDPEDVMVADDANRTGKDYCVHCAEQFQIAEMRLITRRDDPHIQLDDDEPHRGPEYWIAIKDRVRACKPCFKEHHESDDQTDLADEGAPHSPSRNQGEGD